MMTIRRDLARGMGVPWAEFWDFLDTFVDLSSTEGLRKLEEYLSKKDFSPQSHEDTGENETSNRFRTPSPGTFACSVVVLQYQDCVLLYSRSFWVAGKHKKFCNSISVGAFLDEGDDISLEEMKNRQNAALTSITSSAVSKDGLKGALGGEFHILPIARHHCGADLIETAAEQDLLCCCNDSLLSPGIACKTCTSSRDRTHNGEKMAPRTPPSSSSSSSFTMLSPVSNLMEVFDRMSLEETPDSPSSCRERKRSGGNRHRESWDSYSSSLATDLSCGLNRLSHGQGPPEGQAAAAADGMEERSSSDDSSEYFEAEENLEGLGRTRGAVSSVRNICARSKSWDHGGRDLSSSGSSGASYKSLDHSNELFSRTPAVVRKGLFILG